MINTFRLISRQNPHQFRQFHKCIIRQTEATSAATATTPPQPQPPPSGVDKPVDPKIDKIANDISALNLIEVAQLSDLLKKRLNLPDAPVMPMGGFVAAPQVEEEEEQVQKRVQTSFTVKLTGYDEKQKIPLIKEIKNLLPDTNLVQAKKFVESVPTIVKADLAKDEAEKLKESLLKVGGTVEIV
ncbi:39S ribosomal protein L12, mitochondrial [Camponotus floridanus]|uniref:39S ribosomal protein L12, mitochondrial n=1 Tax=Camponotus floridanus TaxID=104421 RepID=E2AXN5_CAMFO|nr:39S ribosomal protein L12, mitochondrial isoform X2 [Camponotus floridanus]EFN61816.1 39S ribosomal protein L12, mitochondrial [Camponotus floridanus]